MKIRSPWSSRSAAAWLFITSLGVTWVSASGEFRPDRILVKPKVGANLTALHLQLQTRVLRAFPAIQNLQALQLPPGADPLAFIALYRRSGLVDYAEPDFIVQATLEPNDFRYWDGSLWGLHNTGIYGGTAGADIDAPAGWDTQNTASNIIVAVIDSGVRFTHEDLAANMWVNPGERGSDAMGLDKSVNERDDDGDGYVDDVHGINAILGTGIPWDDYGHGTHVSGTIGGVGNNSNGVVGVAWRIQIMACKFLDANLHGSVSDAIQCIDYARSKGANIINASWGDYLTDPKNGILPDLPAYSTALHDAIARARDAGILFVTASGNDGTDNDVHPLFPASYTNLDNIIAVAATDRNDAKASFSNYGANTVHLGAPGQDIFSCWNGSDSDYRYWSGTSMAAPHVVGVCALVWAHYPGNTYLQIKNRVLAGTDRLTSLTGKCVTGGRLNLRTALGLTPPVLSVGRFSMRLSGDTNKTYLVQASTDLVHWAPISTNQTSSEGFVDFVDPHSRDFRQRFYRALSFSTNSFARAAW